MRCLVVILYVILALASTITAKAQGVRDICHMDEARSSVLKEAARGVFSGLVFTEQPYYAGDLRFHDERGESLTLAQFKGKVLALNMWAMWCAPCRAEMTDLALLTQKSGGENFEVLAVNMDRDGVENSKIHEFLAEVKANNLALYRDEGMKIFKTVRQAIPVRGLPFTLIIDGRGCAVASFAGAAPWGNEDAVHFIETLKTERIPSF